MSRVLSSGDLCTPRGCEPELPRAVPILLRMTTRTDIHRLTWVRFKSFLIEKLELHASFPKGDVEVWGL